jgi:hypothetical protein
MILPFAAVIAGVLTTIVVASFALWKRIMQWGHRSLLPWVKRRVPNFLPFAEDAFLVLDKAIGFTKELAKRVIDAWQALRTRLLKQEVKVKRADSGTYVRQIVNWTYEPNEEKTIQREVIEETISADDLPFEISKEQRLELLRADSYELNLTDIRDKEVLEYEQAV